MKINSRPASNCNIFVIQRMLVVLIAVAAANAPLYFSQKLLNVQQPIFNLDIGLALALMSLHYRLGLALFIIACVVNVLQAISLSYHFGDALDFLATWHFAPLLNWERFATGSFIQVMILILSAVTAVGWVIHKVRPRFVEMFVIIVACILMDFANGSMHWQGLNRDKSVMHVNVAGSPMWNAGRKNLWDSDMEARPLQVLPEARAYNRLKSWLEVNSGGSSILLIIESFGWYEDPVIRGLLDNALLTPEVLKYWSTEIQSEAFSGSTTYGELRTLCGVAGHYSRLTAKEGARCIPSMANTVGYETFGVHGFTPRMFDRDKWWPTIGLSRGMFSRDFPNAAVCEGAFTGICDADVIHKAIELTQQRNRFVYALTLGTHLPLDDVEIPASVKTICLQRKIADRSCNMLAALLHMLSTTARDLASRPVRPLVVIAGDHSPPFNWLDERSAFNSARVPVYILTPK